MKEAVMILFGESFRSGGQGIHIRGLEKSFKGQIKATISQIKFLKYLRDNKKINTRIIIISYNTIYNNHLLDCFKYEDFLENWYFYDNLIGKDNLIKSGIEKINNLYKYKYLLIMRIDLFLKPYFFYIFDPDSKNIVFPSVCFKPCHKVFDCPRVNDMMMFIPRKLFRITNNFKLNHKTWYQLVYNKKINIKDLDTILKTYHDSDTAKDYNPIYYIVNRYIKPPPNKCGNEIFDKFNFK